MCVSEGFGGYFLVLICSEVCRLSVIKKKHGNRRVCFPRDSDVTEVVKSIFVG